MTFTTGIFLTAVRFVEPLFRYMFWSQVHQFYGEVYQPNDMTAEERQVQNDALSSFLLSSLNVELVFILLQSITTFNRKGAPNIFTIENNCSIKDLDLDADEPEL